MPPSVDDLIVSQAEAVRKSRAVEALPAPSTLTLPPGSTGWPIVGETFSFYVNQFKFFEERHAKYGNVFQTNILFKPTIVVKGTDNIRKVYSESARGSVISDWPTSVPMCLGKNQVFSLQGAAHKAARQVLAPALKNKSVSAYAAALHQTILRFVDKWARAGSFNAVEEIPALMFEVTMEHLLGIDRNSDTFDDLRSVYEEWSAGIISLPVDLPFFQMRKALAARETLLVIIQKEIERRREIIDNGCGDQLVDILSIMLQTEGPDGELMPDEQIRDQLLVLVVAGESTTGSALGNFFTQVGLRPDIQCRLQTEQDSIVGCGRNTGCPTADERHEMRYLRNVNKELLRIQTPAPVTFKKCVRAFEVDGYMVPSGHTVVINHQGNHLDEENFDNPQAFHPDRWDTIKLGRQDMYTYTAWSYGSRQCMGKYFAEAVREIFAAELMRRFSFSLSGDIGKTRYHGVTPLIDGELTVQLKPRHMTDLTPVYRPRRRMPRHSVPTLCFSPLMGQLAPNRKAMVGMHETTEEPAL